MLLMSTHPAHPTLACCPSSTLATLANSDDFRIKFKLEPGDLLIVNNSMFYHSRSAFKDEVGRFGRVPRGGGLLWSRTQRGWVALVAYPKV